MIEYEHYLGFSLTDPISKRTMDLRDDFGGIIIDVNDETYDRECMPQVNFITDKNEREDGETFIGANYGVRVIDMTIFLQNEGNDLFRLKSWLNKKHQQWFEWDTCGDIGIWVIEQGNWKSQAYYTRDFNGKIDLKFVAHDPYYRLKQEFITKYPNPIINQENWLSFNGNVRCFPLIKITPNGTQPIIQFKFNNLIVTLTNVDKPIYLDCQKERCYEMNGEIIVLKPFKYSSDNVFSYPYLDPNIRNCYMLLQGSISEFQIDRRTRFI